MNLRTLTAERSLLSIFTITLVLLCGVPISAEEKPIWDWDKEEIIEEFNDRCEKAKALRIDDY